VPPDSDIANTSPGTYQPLPTTPGEVFYDAFTRPRYIWVEAVRYLMLKRHLALAGAVAAIFEAGCHISFYGHNAGCPPMYPVELVYPASGAAGVSTSIGVAIVQGAFSYNSAAEVTVIAPSGATLTGHFVAPPPTPLPSPLATPADVAGDPYSSVPLPTLQPRSTYAVNIQQQIGVDTGCVAIGKTVGYFTTK
jgi:hypothetical protein